MYIEHVKVRSLILAIVVPTVAIVFFISLFFGLWALTNVKFLYSTGGFLPGCVCDTMQVNLTAGQTVVVEWHSNNTVCVAIGNKQEYIEFNRTLTELMSYYGEQNYTKYCVRAISNFLRIFNKTYTCSLQGKIVYTAPKTATYYIVAIPRNCNMSVYTHLDLIIKPR